MHATIVATCTALAPNFPAAACRKLLRAISDLRGKLERRYELSQPHGAELVRASLAEAETLAWETSFPHLFLPLLAEEKISRAFANRDAAQSHFAQAA